MILMKKINIERRNNIVSVCVNSEMGKRNEQLTLNTKKTKDKFSKILNKVKKFSKFNNLQMNYIEQDYYDDVIRVYETPFIQHDKSSKTPTISYLEHCCIPKDWTESITLSLEEPKTIKPIEVFLSLFSISLSPKEVQEVRKAMKGNSVYNKTF